MSATNARHNSKSVLKLSVVRRPAPPANAKRSFAWYGYSHYCLHSCWQMRRLLVSCTVIDCETRTDCNRLQIRRNTGVAKINTGSLFAIGFIARDQWSRSPRAKQCGNHTEQILLAIHGATCSRICLKDALINAKHLL
jgi:hypothetical protein